MANNQFYLIKFVHMVAWTKEENYRSPKINVLRQTKNDNLAANSRVRVHL